MITLFRPVVIETVEQAEALPVGTIIECTHGPLYGVAPHRKTEDGCWFGGSDRKHTEDLHIESDEPIRCVWTALVAIEAEEQTLTGYFHDQESGMARLRTPWEPLAAPGGAP